MRLPGRSGAWRRAPGPLAYHYQHRAEIEPVVQGADRDAAFDTLTASIGSALAADRTLGGATMRSFDRLVERQIQKALAEGKLSGLEGEGKPLPDRSDEAFTDMATAAAVRIMAEAGVLPEEFKIKKLMEAAKQSYREAVDDDAKRIAIALIADLEQRYNIAAEARRWFIGP